MKLRLALFVSSREASAIVRVVDDRLAIAPTSRDEQIVRELAERLRDHIPEGVSAEDISPR